MLYFALTKDKIVAIGDSESKIISILSWTTQKLNDT